MRETVKLLDHPNLPTRAYEVIKRKIVNGEITPGTKLQEDRLAEELGISRTPVREALSRLAQEGLVEIIPRRGRYVVDLSLPDIIHLLEIREALEGMAARLATANITREALARMRAYFEGRGKEIRRKDFEGYLQADMDFHDLLMKTSGNERLVQLMSTLYDHIQMLRLRSVVLPGRAEASLREHLSIIEALEKEDPDLAEERVREHIRNVKADVIKALKGGTSSGKP